MPLDDPNSKPELSADIAGQRAEVGAVFRPKSPEDLKKVAFNIVWELELNTDRSQRSVRIADMIAVLSPVERHELKNKCGRFEDIFATAFDDCLCEFDAQNGKQILELMAECGIQYDFTELLQSQFLAAVQNSEHERMRQLANFMQESGAGVSVQDACAPFIDRHLSFGRMNEIGRLRNLLSDQLGIQLEITQECALRHIEYLLAHDLPWLADRIAEYLQLPDELRAPIEARLDLSEEPRGRMKLEELRSIVPEQEIALFYASQYIQSRLQQLLAQTKQKEIKTADGSRDFAPATHEAASLQVNKVRQQLDLVATHTARYFFEYLCTICGPRRQLREGSLFRREYRIHSLADLEVDTLIAMLDEARDDFMKAGRPEWANIADCAIQLRLANSLEERSQQVDRVVDIQHRDGSIFNKRPFNVRYDEPRIRALLDAKAAATSFDDYKKKLAELGIELPSHITELYESITPSRLLRPRGHE